MPRTYIKSPPGNLVVSSFFFWSRCRSLVVNHGDQRSVSDCIWTEKGVHADVQDSSMPCITKQALSCSPPPFVTRSAYNSLLLSLTSVKKDIISLHCVSLASDGKRTRLDTALYFHGCLCVSLLFCQNASWILIASWSRSLAVWLKPNSDIFIVVLTGNLIVIVDSIDIFRYARSMDSHTCSIINELRSNKPQHPLRWAGVDSPSKHAQVMVIPLLHDSQSKKRFNQLVQRASSPSGTTNANSALKDGNMWLRIKGTNRIYERSFRHLWESIAQSIISRYLSHRRLHWGTFQPSHRSFDQNRKEIGQELQSWGKTHTPRIILLYLIVMDTPWFIHS